MANSNVRRNNGDNSDRAEVSVAKEFFVNVITKDILLEDCILDLIDNSIDAATQIARNGEAGRHPNLTGYNVAISINPDRFLIRDNCGGISIEDARYHAFHFGRTKAEAEVPSGT